MAAKNQLQELLEHVQQKPASVLGNKFFDTRAFHIVDVVSRGDKCEPRVLVISKFRLFLLYGKPNYVKVEKSIHLLNIKELSCINEFELRMGYDENGQRKKLILKTAVSSSTLVQQLISAFLHYFPDIGAHLPSLIDFEPANLYSELESSHCAPSKRGCHSFRRSYAALCDYYDQAYREEVSWDVEKIYAINQIRDLRLDDFSHLFSKDILPILAVLQFSSYFTGVVADGYRFTGDLIEVLLNVLRYSRSLNKIQLRNCNLPRDFIGHFAHALQANEHIPLFIIDMSKNHFDDKKGFTALSGVSCRLSSLKVINFSECNLPEKCSQILCSGLYNALTASKCVSHLTYLCLANNTLKDDVTSLVNLVSLCTSLRVLDITNSLFPLEKLAAALKYGGLQLEELLFSGCVFGKRAGDTLQLIKEYFSIAVNLKVVNLNGTILSPEVMKAILLGLCSNEQLSPIELFLDATCDKGSGAVLSECVGGLRVRTLSIRDNSLDSHLQTIVHNLRQMTCLRKLDVGGSNFSSSVRRSSKASDAALLNKCVLEISRLVAEESQLEELILSNAGLGSSLSLLFNNLAAATSLKVLDVSSNDIGNFVARILSKALQLNESLHTLRIDNNKLTADAFVDIANALALNFTLKELPYPVLDVSESVQKLERQKTLAALSHIQKYLERNRNCDMLDNVNVKRMLADGVQLERGDVSRLEESISLCRRESLPPHVASMINDFSAKIVAECSTWAGATGNRHDSAVISQLSTQWNETAKRVLCSWRWKELCERSTDVASEDCRSIASDNTTSISGLHRPKSIVATVTDAVSFEADPQPSKLTHLQKSRPRLRRGKIDEVMIMSRSSNYDDVSIKSEDSSDRVELLKFGRSAMLEDNAIVGSPVSNYVESTIYNEVTREETPPPVPSRNRMSPSSCPPTVPPKPALRHVLPTSVANDENANARRSVADISRIFKNEP